MILFDYGQTLIREAPFDGLAGSAAVLRYATHNPHNRTAREVYDLYAELSFELGRTDPTRRDQFQIEVPNHMCMAYICDYLDIQFSLTPVQFDRVFWDAASPAEPTPGILEFLAFLRKQNIRTGVISNISYAGDVVRERIGRLIPDHEFEFILPTSEYVYRKPNPRIFRLALQKAGLPAENVWYIGDNYTCDVEGARNVGIFPVWYTGAIQAPAEEKENTLTVSTWDNLRKILE